MYKGSGERGAMHQKGQANEVLCTRKVRRTRCYAPERF